MTLVSSAVFPALEGARGLRDQACSYTLTHTGSHWVLLTRHGDRARPTWSTSLTGHGAAPDAGPRVAQAVAVRVLHERGVDVAGWRPGPGGHDAAEVAEVVAVVAPASPGVPAPRHGLRGLRGH